MTDQSLEELERRFTRTFHRVITWMTLGPLLLLTAVWLYAVVAYDSPNIGAGILFLALVPIAFAFGLTQIARRVQSPLIVILLACIAGIVTIIPLAWLAYIFLLPAV